MTDATSPSPDTHQPRVLDLLKRMLAAHAESDVDCFTCGEKLDCVAELAAAGGDCNRAWPAIIEHLRCCTNCDEEYRALVAVLTAQRAGEC